MILHNFTMEASRSTPRFIYCNKMIPSVLNTQPFLCNCTNEVPSGSFQVGIHTVIGKDHKLPLGVLERKIVLFDLTDLFSHGQCILDFLHDRARRLNQLMFRRLRQYYTLSADCLTNICNLLYCWWTGYCVPRYYHIVHTWWLLRNFLRHVNSFLDFSC